MDPGRPSERVYVALGSNLGDRDAHLAAAIESLRTTADVDVVAVSPVYETDPVGPPPQGPYLNAAVELCTALRPDVLMDRLLAIESERGRSRGASRDEARTLDLDLLLFGGRVLARPELEVPHPRLASRAFVLEPLAQIAADVVHPVLRETIGALAARIRDPAAVRRRDSREGA